MVGGSSNAAVRGCSSGAAMAAERRELERIREAQACPICLDAAKDLALQPCGHTLCAVCSRTIATCPIYRARITGRMRIFL